MRPRFPVLTVVTLSCVLLASVPRSLQSQLPHDPCAEVTRAQVSTALGMPVNAGVSINSLNSACQWPVTGSHTVQLTVQFMVADTYSRLKSGQLAYAEKSPVAGVGDDAFARTMPFSTLVPKMTTLYVKKGTTMVIVRVYGVPDPAKQLAAEKAVAQAVVTKI